MIAVILVLAAAIVTAPRAAAAAITEVHYVMGTYFTITVDHCDEQTARAAMRRCFTSAREVDRRFSRFDPRSELSRLNATADRNTQTVAVSPEMAALLLRASRLRDATGGAFDVSVGSLSALWRTASEWPSPGKVEHGRRRAGAGAFTVHDTMLARRPGVRLDLDGIAKGWAVDQCVTQLRAAGVARAFLSLGESSLYALGAPSGTSGWPVTVRSLEPGRAIGVLRVRDQAVSVSAVFGHERRVGNHRVGHIIDPRTGWPLTAPALAVVVAASATDAEALSKTVLITGRLPPSPQPAASSTVQRPRELVAPAASRRHPSATDAPGQLAGALLVRPDGVERNGQIAFTPFTAARPIPAAAEPIR